MSKIPKTWRLGELTSTTSHNNNKWGGIIIIIGGEMCDVTGELDINYCYLLYCVHTIKISIPCM